MSSEALSLGSETLLRTLGRICAVADESEYRVAVALGEQPMTECLYIKK